MSSYNKYYGSIPWVRILLCIGGNVVFWQLINKDSLTLTQVLSFYLVLNVIIYIVYSPGVHMFLVSDNELIVKNLFRPWFREEVEIKLIRKITLVSQIRIGHIIRVEFNDRRVKGWSTHLNQEEAEELVDNVKRLIQDA